MKKDEFSISLRIRGGSFSSRRTSKELGLHPWIVRAADRHEIKDINSDEPADYWSHRFSFDADVQLTKALAIVVDKIANHTIVLNELRKKGSNVELFIGLTFNKTSAHELDWSVLSKLANAQVGLSWDLYTQ